MVCDCASLRKKSTAVLWQNYDAGFGRILLCVAAGKRSGKHISRTVFPSITFFTIFSLNSNVNFISTSVDGGDNYFNIGGEKFGIDQGRYG